MPPLDTHLPSGNMQPHKQVSCACLLSQFVPKHSIEAKQLESYWAVLGITTLKGLEGKLHSGSEAHCMVWLLI